MTIKPRAKRRTVWVVGLLVLATLPGVALAQHYNGNAADGTFVPTFDATAESTVPDDTSNLKLVLSELDGSDPVLTGTYTIGTWRFAVASVRAAEEWGGSNDGDANVVAEDCLGTVKLNSDTDTTNASEEEFELGGYNKWQGSGSARTEIVGTAFMLVENTETRAQTVGTTTPSISGNAINEPAGAARYIGEVGFLNWNGVDTATVCVHLATSNTNILRRDREFLFPITLTRLPDGSWRTFYDFTSLVNRDSFEQKDMKITHFTFALLGTTMGNWNTHPVTGQRAQVEFSLTPISPVSVPFSATFTTCPPAPAAGDTCASNKGPVTRTDTILISAAPGFHLISSITSPANFGIVRGTNVVKVEWSPPAGPEDVKGYVVSTSAPFEFDASKIHHAYLLSTDACSTEPCSLTLTFPLTTIGGSQLAANGKYETRIVTVYADGHRSDGRCDDGTAFGTPNCVAFTPPGYASTQYLLRTKSWPLVYRDDGTRDNFGVVMRNVLLVDFSTGEIEFVAWQTNNRVTKGFGGSGPGIAGNNDRGGSITFYGTGGIFDGLAGTSATQPGAIGLVTLFNYNFIGGGCSPPMGCGSTTPHRVFQFNGSPK